MDDLLPASAAIEPFFDLLVGMEIAVVASERRLLVPYLLPSVPSQREQAQLIEECCRHPHAGIKFKGQWSSGSGSGSALTTSTSQSGVDSSSSILGTTQQLAGQMMSLLTRAMTVEPMSSCAALWCMEYLGVQGVLHVDGNVVSIRVLRGGGGGGGRNAHTRSATLVVYQMVLKMVHAEMPGLEDDAGLICPGCGTDNSEQTNHVFWRNELEGEYVNGKKQAECPECHATMEASKLLGEMGEDSECVHRLLFSNSPSSSSVSSVSMSVSGPLCCIGIRTYSPVY